jgi:hypothetical protein
MTLTTHPATPTRSLATAAIAADAVRRRDRDLQGFILSGQPAVAAIAPDQLARLRAAAQARARKVRDQRRAARETARREAGLRCKAVRDRGIGLAATGGRTMLVVAALLLVT